jgi:hypothetical protein
MNADELRNLYSAILTTDPVLALTSLLLNKVANYRKMYSERNLTNSDHLKTMHVN